MTQVSPLGDQVDESTTTTIGRGNFYKLDNEFRFIQIAYQFSVGFSCGDFYQAIVHMNIGEKVELEIQS